MKLNIFIDKEREEEVIVYAHEKNGIVSSIEDLINENNIELIGYKDDTVMKLDVSEVYCFAVENNKIYAYSEKEKLQIKRRLYMLEEILPDSFIKINQSCIANIKKIKCFEAAFSGTLCAVFKNGHKDYVSRRNIKAIKERFGL